MSLTGESVKKLDGFGVYEAVLQKLSVAGLFLFVFFAWLGTAGSYLGLLFLTLAFVASIPLYWKRFRQDKVLILSAVFLIYLAGRTLWAVYEFPENSQAHIDDALEWLYLWIFVPLAWSLKLLQNKYRIALLVLAGGFALAVMRHTNWQVCDVFDSAARCGFGFQSILGALLLASCLLGLLVFAPRLIGEKHSGWLFGMRLILWLAVVAIAAEFVILTQTRIVWLAFVLIVPLLLCLRYRNEIVALWRSRRVVSLVLVILVATLLFGVVKTNEAIFDERVAQFKEDSFALMTLQFDEIEADNPSFAIRVAMNRQGFVRWLERPWFGWGSGGISREQFFSDEAELTRHTPHFHNTYLEFMLRFGLVGGAIFLFLVWHLFSGLHTAGRQQKVDKDIYFFLMGMSSLLAVWCLADFQLSSTNWRFFFCVVFGFAYSIIIGVEETQEKRALPQAVYK